MNTISHKRNQNGTFKNNSTQNNDNNIKSDVLFFPEINNHQKKKNNLNLSINKSFQQKKNSSYRDLKKVQKVTFEKKGSNDCCHPKTPNFVKNAKNSSTSTENLHLST